MTRPHLTFSGVTSADFEELAALRIAAMRESLERLGRFDPERARERLRKSFYPEHTQVIVCEGQRVGFYTFRPTDDAFHLDHLYIHPDWQSRGIGSRVMRRLLAEADAKQMPIKLGALRGSESNAFYQRHGFMIASEDGWDFHHVRRCPVSFRLLSVGKCEMIRPLWEQLNAHHASLPSPFASEIARRTFDSRLSAFREKAACGQLRIEVAELASLDAPVAYCVTSLEADGGGEIDSLYVAPSHRRAGIASALLRRALDWLREEGATSQRVVVLHDNPEAAAFYRRFGFQPRNIEFEQTSAPAPHS